MRGIRLVWVDVVVTSYRSDGTSLPADTVLEAAASKAAKAGLSEAGVPLLTNRSARLEEANIVWSITVRETTFHGYVTFDIDTDVLRWITIPEGSTILADLAVRPTDRVQHRVSSADLLREVTSSVRTSARMLGQDTRP
jgi:hypothetical protein